MIWIVFCKTADIDWFLVYFFSCIINCLYNLHKHIAMHTNFTNDTMIFSKFLTLRWKDMMIISFYRVINSHLCLALQWKWAFVANTNTIRYSLWNDRIRAWTIARLTLRKRIASGICKFGCLLKKTMSCSFPQKLFRIIIIHLTRLLHTI